MTDTRQEASKGIAQQSTRDRDALREPLEKLYSQFVQIARGAWHHRSGRDDYTSPEIPEVNPKDRRFPNDYLSKTSRSLRLPVVSGMVADLNCKGCSKAIARMQDETP